MTIITVPVGILKWHCTTAVSIWGKSLEGVRCGETSWMPAGADSLGYLGLADTWRGRLGEFTTPTTFLNKYKVSKLRLTGSSCVGAAPMGGLNREAGP
jgi:hypothetical protein